METHHEGTLVVDKIADELVHIAHPVLGAVPYVLEMVCNRDEEAIVEVYSVGQGLAMVGLLQAYGLNVVCSHVWVPEP